MKSSSPWDLEQGSVFLLLSVLDCIKAEKKNSPGQKVWLLKAVGPFLLVIYTYIFLRGRPFYSSYYEKKMIMSKEDVVFCHLMRLRKHSPVAMQNEFLGVWKEDYISWNKHIWAGIINILAWLYIEDRLLWKPTVSGKYRVILVRPANTLSLREAIKAVTYRFAAGLTRLVNLIVESQRPTYSCSPFQLWSDKCEAQVTINCSHF